jgi:hypothetical protein
METIGVLAGVLQNLLATNYAMNYILGIVGGIVGAFTGGGAWLAHRRMSWNHAKTPVGSVFTHVGSYNLLPDYLLSLPAAAVTALLVIALYRTSEDWKLGGKMISAAP